MDMAKKAIILGITGLVGNTLAQQLFEDATYDEIISFHRRKSGLHHPKLTEHVVDVLKLDDQAEIFKADAVFCCVGTTQAKTPDKEKYKAIDYGIPIAAARLCAKNKIPVLIIISALGADPSSRIFYNRLKGEMERDVLNIAPDKAYLMQPALLTGDREEARTSEKIAENVFKIINPLLIGPLKKYRSINVATVAAAMRAVAENGYGKPKIPSIEIREIAERDEKG